MERNSCSRSDFKSRKKNYIDSVNFDSFSDFCSYNTNVISQDFLDSNKVFKISKKVINKKDFWILYINNGYRLQTVNFKKLIKSLKNYPNFVKYQKGFVFNSEISEQTLKEISDLIKSFKQNQIIKSQLRKKDLDKLYKDFVTSKKLEDIIGVFTSLQMKHFYSFRNQVLAYVQARERCMKNYIGILNSFSNWKEQGFSVNYGEKGLDIFYPRIKTTKEIDKKTNEEIKKTSLAGFDVSQTFDISQTTAFKKYQKQLELKNKLIYNNAEVDYERAIKFVSVNFSGIKIKEDFNNKECKGVYYKNHITLFTKSSATLFHELGHHITKEILDFEYERAKAEIQSELTAYILTKIFDPNAKYNMNYSNCWSSRLPKEYELKDFAKDFKDIVTFINSLDFSVYNSEKDNLYSSLTIRKNCVQYIDFKDI